MELSVKIHMLRLFRKFHDINKSTLNKSCTDLLNMYLDFFDDFKQNFKYIKKFKQLKNVRTTKKYFENKSILNTLYVNFITHLLGI